MAMKIPDFSHLPVTVRRWKLGKRQTIEIHRDLVRVTEKGLFATKWDEPVSAFEGVLRRKDTQITGGEHVSMVTYYLVELVHPDTKKTLRLYQANKEVGIRKLWKDVACALDLPALDETVEGFVARAPEDLDKTIHELVADGKISVDFDADAPPPRGIVLEQAEDELRVTVSLGANSYGTDVLKFVGGTFAILLVSQGVFEGGLRFFVGLVGAFFVLMGGVPLFLDGIAKRCIVITSRELNYFRKAPFSTFSEGHPAQVS